MRPWLRPQRLGVMALTGAAIGIALGQGAARSIDPFFRSSPPQTRNYAGLAANHSPAAAESIPVSAEETRYALGDSCIGCRPYATMYHADAGHAVPASLGTDYDYRPIDIEAPPPPPIDPDREAVARYASYPVTDTDRDLREMEERAAAEAEKAMAAREADEKLRAAEEKAVPRGPEQLIY